MYIQEAIEWIEKHHLPPSDYPGDGTKDDTAMRIAVSCMKKCIGLTEKETYSDKKFKAIIVTNGEKTVALLNGKCIGKNVTSLDFYADAGCKPCLKYEEIHVAGEDNEKDHGEEEFYKIANSILGEEYLPYHKIDFVENNETASITGNKPKIYDAGYDQYKNVNLYRCDCPVCGEMIFDYSDDDLTDDADGDCEKDFYKAFDLSILKKEEAFCSHCGCALDWSEKNDG